MRLLVLFSLWRHSRIDSFISLLWFSTSSFLPYCISLILIEGKILKLDLLKVSSCAMWIIISMSSALLFKKSVSLSFLLLPHFRQTRICLFLYFSLSQFEEQPLIPHPSSDDRNSSDLSRMSLPSSWPCFCSFFMLALTAAFISDTHWMPPPTFGWTTVVRPFCSYLDFMFMPVLGGTFICVHHRDEGTAPLSTFPLEPSLSWLRESNQNSAIFYYDYRCVQRLRLLHVQVW